MSRLIGLLLASLLVASSSLVALSSAPGVASAASATAAKGKVTVTIRAPNGVAADVTLKGPRTALFAKAASGTRKSVSRLLPAGRYRVRPQAVVSHGVLYQSPSHQTVTVAAGHPVQITVRFSKVPSASSLHATSISTTSISLAWSAPKGATFALRRTAGSQPVTSRRAGAAVHVTGHTAVDTHLKAGGRYAYALFTHLGGRWVGPITLLAGTSAPAGSKTASYVANPGTVLATPTEVDATTATGSGVQVTLTPAVTTPVIGSTVVLPQSASLPGGYLGRVSGISADGSTLTLQPASLSDAFSYYNIDSPQYAGAAVKLTPSRGPDANAARPGAAPPSCEGSSAGTVTFSPSLRLGGSFHAKINTTGSLHVPKGASLSMELTATVTGAMSVETSTSLSCGLSFGDVMKTLTVDPVPISVLFSPGADVSIDGAVTESNLGASATGGVRFSGTLGVSRGAHFSGSDILTARPLTPDVTSSGSIGLTLGGEVVVGPGAGDPDTAGVIAGLSGEFDPLDASFGPVFPQDANACLKLSAGIALKLGLTAKAWLGSWSVARRITFDALLGHGDFPGSPWYYPADCESQPVVNGGTLPDGQVSTLYNQTLPASGGTPPYSWTIINGSLPAGLTLGSDGVLSGTPVSPGTSQFTAQVTDNNSKTAAGTFSLTVNPAVTTPDAISEYDVSPDLNCAMYAPGDTNGEFYGNTACGTIMAVNGQLYGPASIPAGGNLTGAANYSAWTPVNETTSGSGTSGDPYVITTAASADGSPITVSQTDTYAVGGSTVNTTTTLTNTSGSPVQLTLYHAFDCYPGDSDTGTGTSSGGSVSCVSDNVTSNGARTLRLNPVTGGSTYVEEYYGELWSDIATGNPFPDTVRTDDHDTSEGLAWQATVPANGSVSVHYSTDLLLTQQ
jgi:hypothetical protein